MKERIKREDLRRKAMKHGLIVHKECGGYRLVKMTEVAMTRNVYPEDGICPVTSKRNLNTFLDGCEWVARLWKIATQQHITQPDNESKQTE